MEQELRTILQFTQAELYNYISYRILEFYDNKVYDATDYIIALGDIPILLVCHLDTVFDKPPTTIFYDNAEEVCWSPQGLGADDRAGVYAIIQILRNCNKKPSVLFTTNEEIGGIGAEYAAKLKIKFNYIIELDRSGVDDCVFYSCENDEFKKYIENFGFTTQPGTFSDISILCPHWNVAGVNLSIGYVNEHTRLEHLSLTAMRATIRKVCKMLNEKNIPEFTYFKED